MVQDGGLAVGGRRPWTPWTRVAQAGTPLSNGLGTYKTVKVRYWHTYDSQGQILAHVRQSRPDTGLGFQMRVFNTFSRFARKRVVGGTTWSVPPGRALTWKPRPESKLDCVVRATLFI